MIDIDLKHPLIKPEDMSKIEDIIKEKLMYIPVNHTYGKIFDMIRKKEITKSQFKNLIIYFYET